MRILMIPMFWAVLLHAHAQRHCLHEPLRHTLQIAHEIEAFNVFLDEVPQKITSRTGNTFKIPVVFHIIHQGEAIGVGANMSDEKVYQQLAVINEDFNALNTDISQVPEHFKSLIGSTGFEFCLANINPQGEFQPGIVRHLYEDVPDIDFIEQTIKAQTSWNSYKYLNIWIVRLPETETIGYSYLPTKSVVGSHLDGVVVQADKFGINPTTQSSGRTLTHELGHYFGLLHPWGDSLSCETDDRVEDTPNCDEPTYVCPKSEVISCEATKMHMNFMDYAPDRCMNMFSKGQADAMKVVAAEIRHELLENGDKLCSASTCVDQVLEDFESPSWGWTMLNTEAQGWVYEISLDPDEHLGKGYIYYTNETMQDKQQLLFAPCMEFSKNTDYILSYRIVGDSTPTLGFSYLSDSSDFTSLDDYIITEETETVGNIKDILVRFSLPYSEGFSIGFSGGIGTYKLDNVIIQKRTAFEATTFTNSQHIKPIKIFPNPTTDIIQIDVPKNEPFTYDIFSISGMKITSGQGNTYQDAQINVLNLPTGLYYLKVRFKSGIFNGNFLKQ